jgi:hypothetical protein
LFFCPGNHHEISASIELNDDSIEPANSKQSFEPSGFMESSITTPNVSIVDKQLVSAVASKP